MACGEVSADRGSLGHLPVLPSIFNEHLFAGFGGLPSQGNGGDQASLKAGASEYGAPSKPA